MTNAWILPLLPIATATSAGTALGTPAYVGNDYAGVIWRSTTAASNSIVIDLGADAAVDTIMLFGIRGPAAAATIKVDAATNAQGSGFGAGSFWAGTAGALYAGSAVPVIGGGRCLWSAPTASPPPAARYWRITVTPPSGTGFTEIGRVAIGRRIVLDRNFAFGAAFGVKDLGKFDLSPLGVIIRRRSKKLRTTGLSFPNARRDEVERKITPLLEQIGNTDVVAVATDPDPHEQRQNRMYCGPIVGDLGVTWAKADGFEARADLLSLF